MFVEHVMAIKDKCYKAYKLTLLHDDGCHDNVSLFFWEHKYILGIFNSRRNNGPIDTILGHSYTAGAEVLNCVNTVKILTTNGLHMLYIKDQS